MTLFAVIVLQPLQNYPPDPGHASATPAKSSLSSGARFCNPCKNFPQIWVMFLQPLQSLPPVLGHVSATPAKMCPGFGATYLELITLSYIFGKKYNDYLQFSIKSVIFVP